MRLPFRRWASGRPQQQRAVTLAALAALAPSLSRAITFNPVPSANLDFSRLGSIAVTGDFSGISLYEFEGQNERQSSLNGSESLLAQLPNGALASIISTDASIRAMCTFMLSTGDMQGVVIGGNFTSLDGTKSTAVALFNPNTTEITPLDGLEGEVNALLCDQDRNTVYVGGNFKGANSTNAIAWYGTEGWTNLPFAGFNGPVEAITKASNGHIIFGGGFTSLGNTSAPSEPDQQSINLSTANISAENSVSTGNSGNPKNIICSDGSATPWLLEDKSTGTWEAEFSFGFEPTKLRLWNTHQDGRGTKTFRFIAFPINGIMNFTYVDPSTGKNQSCTSECPLSDDTSVEFQDFHFVNRVGMNKFQIAISDWYGDGAGLAGIELLQDNIFAYAVTDFNEPTCGGIEFPSTATATGPWKESPSLQSTSKYLTAKLKGKIDPSSASVVFTPNIRQSGNYSVNMYTPGCKPDETCSTRGRVNITGTMASGNIEADFTTSLYQTNNFDKYDQVYFGYIEQTSDSFAPSVTLTPLADQDVDTMTLVAQRVGFTLISSTGGLNGLFDFDPDNAVVNTSSLEDSAVNRLGAGFDRNTGVTSLITSGDVTYVGGNFTSKDHVNIVAINSNDEIKSLDGGLNGRVFDMHLNGTKLFVGGDFSNTLTNAVHGMNHVAVYDTKANNWSALGAGVDGEVEYVVPLKINITENEPETVITFTGVFEQCNAFDDFDAISVDGFAVWVPSRRNWLQNIGGSRPTYSGILTAALLDLPNGDSIFAGSMVSSQLGVNGAATLNNKGFGQFPVDIKEQSPSSNVARRDVPLSSDISGVVTGLFFDENDQNITILAGHFTAQVNGTTIHNLILIDGSDDGSVRGLGSGVSNESTFAAVAIQGDTIFAGGKVSGTIDGTDIKGLVSFDIPSHSFKTQPASISGANGTVSAIAARPGTSEVYVGGSFDKAGALDCPGICMYDTSTNQWNRPGTEIAGNVDCLMWSSKTELIVAGNLTNGSDTTYIATYNAKKQTWSNVLDSGSIPGPVEVIAPGSNDGSHIWAAGTSTDDGSVFLMKYNGKKWIATEKPLPAGTVVRSLQVFSLTKEHDESNLLDKKQALMLTGSIVIPDFGVAAAAIFNGTTYQPYALTTGSGTSPGTIAKIFTQNDSFFSSIGGHMPLVFVILIGLAIALGLMLFLVLGGMILDRLRKRREGYAPAPTSMYDRGSGIRRIPPRELLESLGKGRSGAPHV